MVWLGIRSSYWVLQIVLSTSKSMGTLRSLRKPYSSNSSMLSVSMNNPGNGSEAASFPLDHSVRSLYHKSSNALRLAFANANSSDVCHFS